MPDDFEELIPMRLKSLGKDEGWLQDLIADNPQILGLGEDVVVRDKERRQTTGGILDLLLENGDNLRWEVEIQLGATDASHIVRTIEYWDIERKRYPQYEHRAVIVAEEITDRFFNVIALFNGHIPITAIKLTAVKLPGGKVGVLFTKILDTQTRDDESSNDRSPVYNRAYWVEKASEAWWNRVQKIYANLNDEFGCSRGYNRESISLKKSGKRETLIYFLPDGGSDVIVYTGRRDKSIERRLDDLGWKHECEEYGKYGERYCLDFPSRDLAEEDFALLRDMFRVAIGEEIESESTPPVEAENSNA